MMATLGLAGCGSGNSDNDKPVTPPVATTPPAPVVTPPVVTPPVVTPPVADVPCNFTTTPGAAVAADASAYSAPVSEALNPNVITAPTVKPSVGGALQTKKINCMVTLAGADGKAIQLRGMSTGGLQWFPEVINDNTFNALSKDWGANVVRLAMYVGEGGYATKPDLINKVTQGIDLAIANDMYVIVDWHVLTPGDPNADVYKGAMEFFRTISQKYPNNKNIIYELANEPNSGAPGVTNDAAGWKSVKSYATPIIAMLRAAGNKNLVIVGSPSWSQRPDLAAADPIDDANVMYTVHFYSGTHLPSNSSTAGGNVMSNARYALEHGVGIFVTESGVSEASGDKGPYLKAADQWIDFLNKHNVSWVNWMLANKSETSAALLPTTSLDPGTDHLWSNAELSVSGEYIRSRIKGIAYVASDRAATGTPATPGTGTGAPTGPAFTTTVSDFADGTLGGWGLNSDSPTKAVTLSNDAGALKLSGMAASSDVSAGNFWANVRLSADGLAVHPNLYGAKTLTADVTVDAATTVAIAAIPQSTTHGWANPTGAVILKPTDFVAQSNGKFKATVTITLADSPNFQAIAADTDTAGSTMTNLVLFVGAKSDTVTIDNIAFAGNRPATP
jgi:endoglucanase